MSVCQPCSVSRSSSLVLERIAEHAERADLHVGVADGLLDLAGKARNVLVAHRLPEERLDALEAVLQDRADIGGRIGCVGLHHGSDAYVEKRVGHADCVLDFDRDDLAGLGASDRAEHHRQAVHVVGAHGFRQRAAGDRGDELLHDGEVAADRVGIVEWRNLYRACPVEQPVPRLVGDHLNAD